MKITLNNDGANGLKMWEAEVKSQGVTIRYGTVGKTLRTQLIPLASCQNRNATEEAIKRSDAKQKEGYWPVPSSDSTKSATSKAATTTNVSKDLYTSLGAFERNEWF